MIPCCLPFVVCNNCPNVLLFLFFFCPAINLLSREFYFLLLLWLSLFSQWCWRTRSRCAFRHRVAYPTVYVLHRTCSLFLTSLFPKHITYQCLWIFRDMRRPCPLVAWSQTIHNWRPNIVDRVKAEMENRQKTAIRPQRRSQYTTTT